MEDLISIGTIGLIKAVISFDPEKGNRLAAYASRCVENAILSPMGFYSREKSPSKDCSHIGRYLQSFQMKIISCAEQKTAIVQYAPLCHPYIRLIAPRKLLEAQQFNQQYHSYEEIQNVP